jgi:hypothetical protein
MTSIVVCPDFSLAAFALKNPLWAIFEVILTLLLHEALSAFVRTLNVYFLAEEAHMLYELLHLENRIVIATCDWTPSYFDRVIEAPLNPCQLVEVAVLFIAMRTLNLILVALNYD